MFRKKEDVDRLAYVTFQYTNSESEQNLKCYRIAKHYYSVNDYASAIKHVNRYLFSNSNSAAAHKLLGDCYLKLNKKPQALEAFKMSLKIDSNQQDLVLQVCKLLSDPDVPLDSSNAENYLELCSEIYSKDPAVSALKSRLMKSRCNKENFSQLEKLYKNEVEAHPKDLSVMVRYINFLLEFNRYQEAYDRAIDFHNSDIVLNNLNWFKLLCRVTDLFSKLMKDQRKDVDFEFYIKKLTFLEKRAELSIQEFRLDSKLNDEYTNAVFEFDQVLHSATKLEAPASESDFFCNFLRFMGAQLDFHLATLMLKRGEKDERIWEKLCSGNSPILILLLRACQDITFTEDGNNYSKSRRNKNDIDAWNKSGSFRVSQAGHILRGLAGNNEENFLSKVPGMSHTSWQDGVYSEIFREPSHQRAKETSYFMHSLNYFSPKIITEEELHYFDDTSQLAYPESLRHLVWLGLVSLTSDNQLYSDFRCLVVPDMPFSVNNLFHTNPETVNQLDVDAFLYATVLCAKEDLSRNRNLKKPPVLPVSITENLCSLSQENWWSALFTMYRNDDTDSVSDMRRTLRKGIETIRVIGQHNLHVRLIIALAKLFQSRASMSKDAYEFSALEARCSLYWSAVIRVLENYSSSRRNMMYPSSNRLFDYRGKELSPEEVRMYLGEGRAYLSTRSLKGGLSDDCLHSTELVKSPYSTAYHSVDNRPMWENLLSKMQSVVEELRDIKISQTNLKLEIKEIKAIIESEERAASQADSRRSKEGKDLHTYQNFPNYQQMPNQGTGFPYGNPVLPQVPNMYPGANPFCAPPRPVNPMDPLLFYQTLNYYAQGGGLPLLDHQSLTDFRTTIQNSTPLPSNIASVSDITPNVGPSASSSNVIESPKTVTTSSVTTPTVSDTASRTPSFKSSSDRVSAFHMQMPPDARLIETCPFDSNDVTLLPVTTSTFLNGLPSLRDSILDTLSPIRDPKDDSSSNHKFNSSNRSSDFDNMPDPIPDFKPIIPLPDEVQVITGEEDEVKIFEARAKLFRFVEKRWAESGVGNIKILHNESTGSVRIVMRREQVFKVCANHLILPDMEINFNQTDDRALMWVGNDYSDETPVTQLFSVRFKTKDEAADFKAAFEKGREIGRENAKKKLDSSSAGASPNEKPKGNLLKPATILATQNVTKPAVTKTETKPQPDAKVESTSWECSTCKIKYDSTIKKCAACEIANEVNGGFNICKPSILKEPTFTVSTSEKDAKSTIPNPFASFSFRIPATTTAATVTSTTTTTTTTVAQNPTTTNTNVPFGFGKSDNSPSSGLLFSSLASSIPHNFKNDPNFKGFEGTGGLVFGYLKNNEDDAKNKSKDDAKNKSKDDEKGGDEGEFVPTAEFAPVVPLPDLVEVKTGEEEEIVLFEEKAKLLRFVSETKEWKERGVGKMKVLLNDKSGKVRLLMRREQVLKVCCNHFLDEKMEFKPNLRSERVLTWCAQDFSEESLKTELLGIRFAKAETLEAFKRVIEEYQKKMKNGRVEGKGGEEAAKKVEEEQKPLSELFKSKPGSWECGTCYVRNNADVVKCVSCETPKPGAGPSTPDAGKKTEEKKEPKGIYLDPSLMTKFSFGIPPSTQESPATPTASNAASIFGAAATKNQSDTKPMFTFGIPAANKTPATTAEVKTPPTFTFSMEQKETEPSTVFSSPAIKPLSFGSTNKDTPTSSPLAFTFNQQNSKSPQKDGKADVSADENGADDSTDSITFTPVVPLPDEIVVKTGEEDENVMYTARAKLFRFRDSDWKERGKGDIKVLKHKTTNRVRLVMRWDQILKICLNHYVTPEMDFTRKDEKSWMWCAGDFSDEKLEFDQFAIRFKNEKIAQEFRNAIADALKNDGSGDMKGKTVAATVGGSSSLSSDAQATKPISTTATTTTTQSLFGQTFSFSSPSVSATTATSTPLLFSSLAATTTGTTTTTTSSFLTGFGPPKFGLTPTSDSILNTFSLAKTTTTTATTTPSTTVASSIFSTAFSKFKSGSWGTFQFEGNTNRNPSTFMFGNSPEALKKDSLRGDIPADEEKEEEEEEEAENNEDEEDEDGNNDDEEEEEDDVDDDDEIEREEEDDEYDEEESNDEDYLENERKLVLEKQNFIFQKWSEASDCFVQEGKSPSMQIFELNPNEYEIQVTDEDHGEIFAVKFDPACEKVIKNGPKHCVWMSSDGSQDRNIAVDFSSEKDLNDFLRIFGESEPEEDSLSTLS